MTCSSFLHCLPVFPGMVPLRTCTIGYIIHVSNRCLSCSSQHVPISRFRSPALSVLHIRRQAALIWGRVYTGPSSPLSAEDSMAVTCLQRCLAGQKCVCAQWATNCGRVVHMCRDKAVCFHRPNIFSYHIDGDGRRALREPMAVPPQFTQWYHLKLHMSILTKAAIQHHVNQSRLPIVLVGHDVDFISGGHFR